MLITKWICQNGTCEFTTDNLDEFIEHLKEHEIYIDYEIEKDEPQITIDATKLSNTPTITMALVTYIKERGLEDDFNNWLYEISQRKV